MLYILVEQGLAAFRMHISSLMNVAIIMMLCVKYNSLQIDCYAPLYDHRMSMWPTKKTKVAILTSSRKRDCRKREQFYQKLGLGKQALCDVTTSDSAVRALVANGHHSLTKQDSVGGKDSLCK